jgi:hypothetical protein
VARTAAHSQDGQNGNLNASARQADGGRACLPARPAGACVRAPEIDRLRDREQMFDRHPLHVQCSAKDQSIGRRACATSAD